MELKDVSEYLAKVNKLVSEFETEEYSCFASKALKGVNKIFILPTTRALTEERISSALIESLSATAITFCDITTNPSTNKRHITGLRIVALREIAILEYEV